MLFVSIKAPAFGLVVPWSSIKQAHPTLLPGEHSEKAVELYILEYDYNRVVLWLTFCQPVIFGQLFLTDHAHSLLCICMVTNLVMSQKCLKFGWLKYMPAFVDYCRLWQSALKGRINRYNCNYKQFVYIRVSYISETSHIK